MLRSALVILLVSAGCQAAPDAQRIVDRAIAWQGGHVLDKAVMEFDFRDRHFRILRNDGLFEYSREYADSTGASILEVLSNDGLYREVDGSRVELDSAAYASAETAVNSVVYFALLPLPLNDPAARKRYLGSEILDGRETHEIEVTFSPEGGGRDFEDRFVYWFDAETAALAFMAYYFHVDDGGSRFRKAVNVREVSGVQVIDYLNYKSDMDMHLVQDYDSVYTAGGLDLVSEINLENVTISPIE